MHELSPLAYSLSQQEDGWRWTVYDSEGVTVADGANVSFAGAQQAVNRTLSAADSNGQH